MWQYAAACGKMPHMAKSISISDRLYAACRDEAAIMNRSIAQQLEHWAMLGRASEPEPDTRSRLVALALRERQAQDERLLASGKLNSRDLMLFGHVDMSTDVKVDLLQGLKR